MVFLNFMHLDVGFFFCCFVWSNQAHCCRSKQNTECYVITRCTGTIKAIKVYLSKNEQFYKDDPRVYIIVKLNHPLVTMIFELATYTVLVFGKFYRKFHGIFEL